MSFALIGRPTVILTLAVAALQAQNTPNSTGRELFETAGCLECHSIGNRGGSLGPDLTEAGAMHSPQSLRRALLDPGAEIARPYQTIVVIPRNGNSIEGIALNEDDVSIQIRTTDGNLRSFKKENLRGLRREARSLMPSYASKLSPAQIDSLVAYLGTFKGTHPPPGTPVRRARDIAGISENLDFLDRPERDNDELPESLLDALQIRPGSSIADLGAGTGYFTWRLGQRTGPTGRVVAVDIQPKMLDLLAREVKQRNLDNVELVLGSEHDPHLPEGAFDLVFIAYAYHEFSQPEEVMGAVRRSLKPGGRVVVLEYALESAYTPVPGLHKMNLRDIRSEIEPMGFAVDQMLPVLFNQHCVVFVRWP